MVNRIVLIGNLGSDVKVTRLDNGASVAKVGIATNENYKDKNGDWQTQTEWHDLVLWRDLAERAEGRLKKGLTVYAEGKLTHRKYTDKDGIERRSAEIVVSYYRVLDKREGITAQPSETTTGYMPSEGDAPANDPDSDLPF